MAILEFLHANGYILFEGTRNLLFKGKVHVSFERNFGAPLSFDEFVDSLLVEKGYTDLVAVHRSVAAF